MGADGQVDREHVRTRVAAALKGEEYSVIEMAHDLERLATHPIWEQNSRAVQDLEMVADALDEILDDLGANRHIRWAPNYPEVDHAVQVAQEALAVLRAAGAQHD